jgi:hypothetical protein
MSRGLRCGDIKSVRRTRPFNIRLRTNGQRSRGLLDVVNIDPPFPKLLICPFKAFTARHPVESAGQLSTGAICVSRQGTLVWTPFLGYH